MSFTSQTLVSLYPSYRTTSKCGTPSGGGSSVWNSTSNSIFANDSTIGILNFSGSVYALGVNLSRYQIPQGAIIAFNRSCPIGWIETDESLGSKRQSAEAGVNFKGTSCTGSGNTCTIRDSFNVDNVTRETTGDYTIYWSRDFANANYNIVGSGRNNGAVSINFVVALTTGLTSGAARVTSTNDGTGTPTDAGEIYAIAFGNDTTSLTYCTKTGEDTSPSNSFWGNTNNKLFVQNTSWLVGIGTINPSEKLEVIGNVKIDGNLTITGNSTGSTPSKNTLYAEALPKAWVNFDGAVCSGTSGSCGTATCTIRSSFNVECVDRLYTGGYIVYWDRDFANADYMYQITAKNLLGNWGMVSAGVSVTAGTLQFEGTRGSTGTLYNSINNNVIAFGTQ